MNIFSRTLTNIFLKIKKFKSLNIKKDINLDAFRELNTIVETTYTAVEFVAVAPDFDVTNYLSLREGAGIFKFNKVNLYHVIKIADAVKHSPVFATMNNALLSASSCMYFLSIVNELGLILKSIHNPMRMDGSKYTEFIKQYEKTNESYIYIRGQEIKHLNFIIINLFSMMNQNVINEAFETAQSLQQYQTEVDEKINSIGKL